jgi:hypothetical protein
MGSENRNVLSANLMTFKSRNWANGSVFSVLTVFEHAQARHLENKFASVTGKNSTMTGVTAGLREKTQTKRQTVVGNQLAHHRLHGGVAKNRNLALDRSNL